MIRSRKSSSPKTNIIIDLLLSLNVSLLCTSFAIIKNALLPDDPLKLSGLFLKDPP